LLDRVSKPQVQQACLVPRGFRRTRILQGRLLTTMGDQVDGEPS